MKRMRAFLQMVVANNMCVDLIASVTVVGFTFLSLAFITRQPMLLGVYVVTLRLYWFVAGAGMLSILGSEDRRQLSLAIAAYVLLCLFKCAVLALWDGPMHIT